MVARLLVMGTEGDHGPPCERARASLSSDALIRVEGRVYGGEPNVGEKEKEGKEG